MSFANKQFGRSVKSGLIFDASQTELRIVRLRGGNPAK
jgi:hypothetical protein